MNGIVYSLITARYATLKEIRDDYNIYEVLDLYECFRVENYNRMIIMEESKEGR